MTVTAHEPSAMELLARDVHATMNDPSVALVWSAKGVKRHDQPRRIVWARVDPSQIVTPEEAGGRQHGGANGVRYNVTRIREQVMDLHIYGEHEAAIDQILKNVVAAIDLTIQRVRFLAESWTTETADAANNTHRPKCVVRAVFRLNVPDEVSPLRPLLGTLHACGILQADGSVNSS